MRPTPNLPNSTILNPILTKIQNTNIISASLFSYANFLLNLIKTNEKTNDLEVKLSNSKNQSQPDIKKTTSEDQNAKKVFGENLSYFYALTESVKSISNLSLLYEKYLNSNKTADNSTKEDETNMKNTHQIKRYLKADEPQSKKVAIQTMELYTARKTEKEKITKLFEAIEKASGSSNLVKYAVINDLFQALYSRYDNLDIHYMISKNQKNLIRSLKALRLIATQKQDKKLISTINECLALIGYVDQTSVRHHGINILSLDGGGAKGLVTIEILKEIQKKCGGKPIHEIFDYICGVSTGAILASLLGVFRLSLDECEQYYKGLSRDVFDRNMAAGLSNLIRSYSYYDTQQWENMLRHICGNTLFINSAKDQNACKIGIVSNITTTTQMKVFVFRNYNLPSFSQSHYDGTCKYKVWEAVRASSAAPGYYEEFKLDGFVFHDGGVLANNPTAIAIHEAKLLWPKTDINCVVSVGNGRYKPEGYASSKANSVSLKQKINRFVAGISSTENVHTMLCDLLPTKVYYRFNPYMSEEFSLDEVREEKWDIMKSNTKMYMRRNDEKFKLASKQLLKPKSLTTKIEHLINQNLNCAF